MHALLILGVLLCVCGGFAETDGTSNGIVFCYYSSWSVRRTGPALFGVSDLPVDLCTHIAYAFLGLTATGELTFPTTQETIEGKTNNVDDFINLKKTNPDLKILFSIAGPANFTIVVNNDTLRANFVNNIKAFVDEKGFDGVDLDWEYPGLNGVTTDKENFVNLVKELKAAFAADGYLLTSAVGVTQSRINTSFDVPQLNEYLDYFNLMLYNYHGTWDNVTGVNAPLYPQLTDTGRILNANHSVNIWIENGASPSKLTMGLAAYGRTFTLASLDNTSTGAPNTGAGVAGPYNRGTSSWSYLEICDDQTRNPSSWNITEVTGNYVYANKDTFWVGYDNPNTIYAKAQYAKNMKLGGIMYWAVDMDDFSGVCGSRHPLINSGIAGYNSV